MLFTRTVSAKLRRPLWLIILSILLTFVVATVQSTLLSDLGINIPIPVLNLPCIVLLSYAVLRSGFLGVAPTALNMVFEVIDQGIIVIDGAGKVVEHNRRASELMSDIAYADCLKMGSDISELMRDAPKSAGKKPFSIDNLPAELKNAQRSKYISLACHTLEKVGGKFIGHVLVLTDITLLKVRAEIDSLTGSYNREGLTSAFMDLQKNPESNPYVSAMIIDLDNFKTINGHIRPFWGRHHPPGFGQRRTGAAVGEVCDGGASAGTNSWCFWPWKPRWPSRSRKDCGSAFPKESFNT